MIHKANLIKSEKHRRFVSHFLCVVCLHGTLAETPDPRSQAAHIDLDNESGLGRKAGDDKTVPLCVPHHDEHDGRVKGAQGEAFWAKYRLDPRKIIAELIERSPYVEVANV